MPDRHMGVAEVKRHFADVIGEVMHTKSRVIVERRGRPVVAIVPLGAPGSRQTPGQRLAAAVGCAGEDGESFVALMDDIVRERRTRRPRHIVVEDA